MSLTIFELILLIFLFISFVVQLWFVLGVHLKLAAKPVDAVPIGNTGPVSVIICARNEAENLQKFLPSVLEQDYPEFEVVVVNDRSWDGTKEVLEVFSEQYKHLKLVNIADGEKFIAGKKFGVSMGIKAAAHAWLVFTDADCQPASRQWLRSMQPPTTPETELVLGYSPYFKKGSFLNLLVRYETFFTAINYLSFVLKGMPYMGVGRNMAYRKDLFFKSKGFAAHMHIPSGDDDLFVNANATPENTAIIYNKDAHVWSEPVASWRAYLRQKRRHFGAGKLYKPAHKWVLSLQIIFQCLFYGTFAALCFYKPGIYFAGAIMLLSIVIKAFVYPKLLARLNYRELQFWFPIMEVVLCIFLLVNTCLSIFVKKAAWK